MKRRLVRLLPWIVGLVLIILVIRLVSLESIVAVLAQLRWWQLAVLAVANLVVLILISARWWVILMGLGHTLPFGRVFVYRLAAFGLSYFTPGPHVGGEPLQVILVERHHDVPRSKAVGAVTVDKSLELLINFAFLLLGVALILRWRLLSLQAGWATLMIGGLLLLTPLIYLSLTRLGYRPVAWATRPLAHSTLLSRWSHTLARANLAIAAGEAQVTVFLQRSPGTLALAILLTLVAWTAMVAEYWLMVAFLGVRLTFPQLVVTLTAARIAILLLLPAGLGIMEISQTLAFGLLGLDPAVGISASLLIRTRDTLLGAVGLWLGSRLLSQPTAAQALASEEQ